MVVDKGRESRMMVSRFDSRAFARLHAEDNYT